VPSLAGSQFRVVLTVSMCHVSRSNRCLLQGAVSQLSLETLLPRPLIGAAIAGLVSVMARCCDTAP
jgi:hypothetical protein